MSGQPTEPVFYHSNRSPIGPVVERFKTILADVSLCGIIGGWQIKVALDGPRPYLQVHDPAGVCNVTGTPLPWAGRKWFLSPHMTRTEIVQTAFKAVSTALEHEMREGFLFRGESVFDPHLDVDTLVEMRRKVPLDARPTTDRQSAAASAVETGPMETAVR